MHYLKQSLVLILFFLSQKINAQIVYPKTPKNSVINVYHDKEIVDDYQWLEYQEKKVVSDWIKNQNKLSLRYLRKLSRSTNSENQFNRYLFRNTGDYEGKLSVSDNRDKLYFRFYVSGNNSTPSLYYKKGIKGVFYVLVNSSSISSKDKIDITYYKTSKDNTFLAYQYKRNGSDWTETRIVKIPKKRHYSEVLKQTRTGNVYWFKQGFFYEKYPFDSINGKKKKPEILYHAIGTKQEEDTFIFKSRNEDEYIDMFGSSNEDLFIIKKENFKTKRYNYYLFNPEKEGLNFTPFLKNIPYDLNIFKFENGHVFAISVINDKKHLISIPLNEPTKLMLLSPSYEDGVLSDIEMMKDKIVISYYTQKGDILVLVDYKGNVLNEVTTPKGLSIKGLVFSEEYKKFFFFMESYTIPSVLYKLDLETFTYEMVEKTRVNFDSKNYKFKQDYFISKDGTRVPIFIVFKDSLSTNGKTPFLLKTYGGYGTLGKPRYNSGIVYFLENGGAFAYVNIRGGGELGNQWWENGKRLNKKNGIQDFVSAAEYLINKGFTSPKKIAITGTSHGGLITAAALIKRPDLFGSAVIDVAPLDMLRFENFTVGASIINISEFGTVTDSTDFKNLYSYSPYHNIKDDVNYPSMLITTGTHDDRVPALHSFKFAARLQNNLSQQNPILLWTQKKVGHSGSQNINGVLEEYTFIYSFLFHELK